MAWLHTMVTLDSFTSEAGIFPVTIWTGTASSTLLPLLTATGSGKALAPGMAVSVVVGMKSA